MPNNFDKLFNQQQGNDLINALKGIKSSLDVNYPLETVNVTLSNNAQNITPSANYYGLGQVNVPGMNLSDMTILVNGNYDPVTSGLDGYGKLNVNVPTWGQADEGKVVSNNALVPQTNREVNANGTYDTTLNNSVLVNVPNTYGSEDEGKVVMNNALVPQTNRSITQNGTYDTTTNDEVVVNVEGGGSGGSKNILGGTTTPTSADGNDGDIYIKYTDYSSGGGVLPSGYTPIEYIATGNVAGPYIDTGVLCTNTAYFSLDMQYTGTPDNNTWAFGAYEPYKDTILGIYPANTLRFLVGGTGKTDIGLDSNRHLYEAKQDGVYIDGISVGSVNWSNLPANLNYCIFNISGQNSRTKYLKVYSCKIWNDTTLVRDFVPAKRNSDDVLGMYDLVNDVFYTNSGTGSFIGGEELIGTPIDTVYLKVDGDWIILEDGDYSEVNRAGGGGIAYDDTPVNVYAIDYNASSNANAPRSAGFEFTVKSQTLKITKIRVYGSASTVSVHLSNAVGNDIVSVLNASVITGQWNDIVLDEPAILEPNVSYVVWYSAGGSALRYSQNYGSSDKPYITINYGRYSTSVDTFPATKESNVVYGVDLYIDATVVPHPAKMITKTITENGRYLPSTDNADGYSEVVVNVSGGGSSVVLSGTETPSNAIGEDENLYVKYVIEPSTFDYSIGIDSIYRKVNGVWVDYTEPAPPTKGVHIWTKSTGGYDAAMYVQNGYWDVDNNEFVATGEIESVIYTSVQSSTYDCYGIATLGYGNSWAVDATDNVTDGTKQCSSGDRVRTWQYSTSVDFYVWKIV